ncbi:uncharacterized protein FIBRA_02638 [Fibroporia radiculosa]|uniref:Fungal-type protein kinase domain-containing protein n=1 Tax=Fibroporia radiculosa TaxID=599839 RepID=J4HV88_9APHY|nr:uncharacterized protein FIBRA_02638 [Fibroporia radiculosa]CCM00602.1 predicted protein [Fibroporia radiculosa]
MAGKFIRLTYKKFMDTFVPSPHPGVTSPSYAGAFDTMPTNENSTEVELGPSDTKIPHLEKHMYEPFVKCVRTAGLCPRYQVKIAADKGDTGAGSRQKVDAALFREEDVPHLIAKRPNWEKQRLWIEFKRELSGNDPFEELASGGSSPFEASALQRRRNRGQIISYAEEIFRKQHRCFLISVLLLGDYARLLYWDRAGACVSERFNYRQRPELLGDFLWRYSHLTDVQQGLDPSVTWVSKGSAEYHRMQNALQSVEEVALYVKEYFKKSIEVVKGVNEWCGWKIAVSAEKALSSYSNNSDNAEPPPPRVGSQSSDSSDRPSAAIVESTTSSVDADSTHYYLVGRPHFIAPGMAGRGTRGYVAYDPERNTFVFLKDAWRIDLLEIDKEGEVLALLNQKNLMNVPTLVCHRDVYSEVESASGTQRQPQSTVTQRYRKAPVVPATTHNPMKTHTHYRLVVEEVGRPLEDFANGREMVRIVWDCVIAHRDAVELAGILHRDISTGNILLLEIKKITKDGKVGTWQFRSAILCSEPSRAVDIADELESFFHVLLYNGVRYLSHNCPDVGAFLYLYFDVAEDWNGQYKCNEKKWNAIETGTIKVKGGMKQLQFCCSSGDLPDHPLNELFPTLLSWFSARYRIGFADGTFSNPHQASRTTFQSHAPLAEIPQSGHDDLDLFDVPYAKGLDKDELRFREAMSSAELLKEKLLAEQLSDHTAIVLHMRLLLQDASRWPSRDKQLDQLPLKYEYNAECTTMQMSTLKRTVDTLQDPILSSQKRPRTTNWSSDEATGLPSN